MMVVVASLDERILDAIRFGPLDDDAIAQRLGIAHRQAVNQRARVLESAGRLRRYVGQDGKLVNELMGDGSPAAVVTEAIVATPESTGALTEDEVKEAVRRHLVDRGFDVGVAWGRQPGVDIEARHADGRRVRIEAKGEVLTRNAQQHNYFVGMLGELVQRMDDAHATYGLALPDNRQYRGLVARLPVLARRRLGLTVWWVARQDGRARVVEVAPPPA